MNLFIDINAILSISSDEAPNALIAVSKAQWLELETLYPEHCYGDPASVEDRHAYGSPPQSVSAYRIDITGMFGLACMKEANIVLKDQWLAIAAIPAMRPYCKGGEPKTAQPKSRSIDPLQRPKNYDNWFSAVEYEATGLNEFGHNYASRKKLIANWVEEGRNYPTFKACENWAINRGDVLLSLENGEWLVIIDGEDK